MRKVLEEVAGRAQQAQLDVSSGIGLCDHLIQTAKNEDGQTACALAWAVREALVRAQESMESIERDINIDILHEQDIGGKDSEEAAVPEKSGNRADAVGVLRRVYLTIGPMQLHGNLLFHGALNWEANESPQIDHQALMGMGKHLMSAYDTITWALEDFARLLGVDDYQGKIGELVQMVREGEA